MEFLRLKEVEQGFGRKTILSNVNFTIEKGDILGIIGPSGSGKTTLLNMIAGFVEPSKGKVLYMSKNAKKERNLHRHLHELKKHIGFTPQHNSFYHKLTVLENLLHFGRLYGVPEKQLKTNIKNLLNFTRLIDHKHKLADHLSGGMKKRLDITCSLIHKPHLLILDEPTADLDPILQKDTLHLLQEVNRQGVTIVIASHHLESIEWLCNKVAIVHKGRVHSHGSIDEVKRTFSNDHFTIKVASGNQKEMLINHLKTLPIKKIVDKGQSLVIYPDNVEETIKGVLSLIKQEQLYMHNLHVAAPTLNDVFEDIVLAKNENTLAPHN